MDSLLSNLADELLLQDITEPSAVIGALSGDDLEAAYDHVLDQFALALLIGAHENSAWSNGKLVIAANLGNITLLTNGVLCRQARRRGKEPEFFYNALLYIHLGITTMGLFKGPNVVRSTVLQNPINRKDIRDRRNVNGDPATFGNFVAAPQFE